MFTLNEADKVLSSFKTSLITTLKLRDNTMMTPSTENSGLITIDYISKCYIGLKMVKSVNMNMHL